MPKLYIANTKSQAETFSFRVGENRQLISQNIPAGGQIQIYRDADRDTLEHIVAQHRRYGLVAVADIDRTKPFISLCYQFDKPITDNQIKYGIEHNVEVLTEVGKERRDQAAVAIGSNIERAAEEAGQTRVNSLSLEIQEEKQPGDNSTGINEVIHVDKQHGDKPGSKRKVGRK